MWYVCPETALKETWLRDAGVMSKLLSFSATMATDPNASPVYTPRIVSKSDPAVSNVAILSFGAVQVHQTVFPASLLRATSGSFASVVAPTALPFTLPDAPAIATALAKSSFAGNPTT